MKSNSRFRWPLLAAAAALLAGATGCETTLDLPEPPHTPRVALTYTLTTALQDSSFLDLYRQRQLFISNSQRVFDTTRLKGRPDAIAELRDAAGNVVERYRPLRGNSAAGANFIYAGYYRPVLGFRPVPGQAYTLRARLPGLDPVESTLTLPRPAAVESATYVPGTSTGGVGNVFRGRLSLTLRDDPATPNYYLVYARALDQQGQPGKWSAVEVDAQGQERDAPIERFQLSEVSTSFRRDLPFADTGLNGQLITLATDTYFTATNCFSGNCPQPGYLEVHLSSITAEDYNFYLSRRRYEQSDGSFFAEPAPLPSNVRGGYGLFGGATDVTYRIRIF